jgi:hypothetical protein
LLENGTMVAGYRIDGPLGEGGMGVVYRATQISLNRTVALKILAGELSDDLGFRERFRREGQLQAAIDHPHIVTVYEAGETEHGLFLAMRLVRGPTLKDLVRGHELDGERTLRILVPVAEALDRAHEVGLIHRDIKPQNILVGAGDHAYLADFGLTKAPDEASLTETGQFIGTIDYVAPEQIRGEGATERSDVYALAGVLFECVTGRVPFSKPSEPAVLFAHMSEPPPRVTELQPDAPAALDAVILQGMAKVPAERQASASDLMRDAQRALGGTVSTPTPPAPGGGGGAARTVPSDRIVPAGEATVSRAARTGGPGAPTAPARAPAAPTAPAATAPAPAAARGVPLVLIAVLGLAAAIGGFVAGGSGSGKKAAALTGSASSGPLALSFPAGWKRAPAAPSTPGLSFSDQLVLASGGAGGGQLVAGRVAAAGPTLLPRGFLARLPSAPRGEPVRLGQLAAYRYRGLRARGFGGPLTIYAVPTAGGVTTLACLPGSRAAPAFLRDCEGVATTLEVTGVRSFGLGPNARYGRALSSVMTRLGAARTRDEAALRAARTRPAQAAAAATLASAHAAAARALAAAPAGPREQAANAAAVTALRRATRAYRRAAAAARGGDAGGYAAAGRAGRTAEGAARRAISTLGALGYRVA